MSPVFHSEASLLLITPSHYDSLNSMFRAIILVCLQATAYAAFTQAASIDLFSAPVSVDSTGIISELSSVVKENNRVMLTWKVNDTTLPEFFTVERSMNGKDFDVVAVVRLSGLNKKFEYTDDSPLKGRSIYRVMCAWKEGAQFYSSPVAVQLIGDASFKFYPNPVDNILIIRSDAPLDIQISDATGKTRLVINRVQGLQTVNVSTLEKGIYLLRVTNKASNVISQDKLIKN